MADEEMAGEMMQPRNPGEIMKIEEQLKFLADNFPAMNTWEKEFYNSIRVRSRAFYSDKVLEKLAQACKRVSEKLAG
jgi:hypothetical protein